MPKRFQDPVVVPPAVLDGLEAVRRSGETDMLDRARIRAVAQHLGYPEAASWLVRHQKDYSEGIFRGFVSEKQPALYEDVASRES